MNSDSLSSAEQALVATLEPLAGRRIALIAPAGGVADDRIDTALAVCHAAGIRTWLGAHARAHHRYLAGTPAARLVDLHAAFKQPDLAAVWCLRGGYGSAQFVDDIDWHRIPSDVPLVGFSDMSVLLSAFHRHGRRAIHGPVATQLALPGETATARAERRHSMAALVACIDGGPARWPAEHVSGDRGARHGVLVGGNLTTLASIAGTPAAMQLTRPAILLLEDVGEAAFRLERCLYQLLASLDRRHVAAIALGEFARCTPDDDMVLIRSIVTEWAGRDDIPVYAGLPIGHDVINHAWRIGAAAVLDPDQGLIVSAAS
ncbi:LD-carboxypeptidase [Salinisphaera sp. Q1T1-3]|uniref:S66 peptidase family protein n=1 Tax=Salinisphaera sp. Q1T1-3 TaxID=2321229 RepID=UPI000E71CE64|nr:LD-carboxypeptidase [Salinisphaera sp. Q1T1-3]RJS93056.1 LD-carboxypeptidase [Salinisphaera sp. Q1T1-3]